MDKYEENKYRKSLKKKDITVLELMKDSIGMEIAKCLIFDNYDRKTVKDKRFRRELIEREIASKK